MLGSFFVPGGAAMSGWTSYPPLSDIAPWRFEAPVSPDMAAYRERREVPFNRLVAFCRERIAARKDVLLIEGVGGVMVPLDDTHTVLDWMVALRIPVLLVAGSYLGTISHTLTAFDVLRRKEVEVRAIVINESEGSTVSPVSTMTSIAKFARAEMLSLPRRADDVCVAAVFRRLVELL